jgi:hypothetical protein
LIPDRTPWAGHRLVIEARDDMQVGVEPALIVPAERVAVGSEPLVQLGSHEKQQFPCRRPLLGGQVERRSSVNFRDNGAAASQFLHSGHLGAAQVRAAAAARRRGADHRLTGGNRTASGRRTARRSRQTLRFPNAPSATQAEQLHWATVRYHFIR